MKTITTGTVLNDGTKYYTVDEHLGTGGFADVYKAFVGANPYAIKVIKSDDPKVVTSIKNEFEIASKVVSEHAIRYCYMNEQGKNGYPCFIIMEYADGGSLYDKLDNRKKCGKQYTTEELLCVYYQLINGMIDISSVAVHRDIKPQNILISNGSYKISDYGLAKYAGATTRATSQTMKHMGSVLYYAPELWAQPNAHGLNDVQVDIYAMGIVFYQLANLRYPYKITTDLGTMHMTEAIEPFNSDVDVSIQSLIRKMMEKSKTKRFSTWMQVKEFLDCSSLGSNKARDPFVEDMLKNTVAKRRAIDMAAEKENKVLSEKETAFKRLISQIQTGIYEPLQALVDAYNKDSAQHHVCLSEIVDDLENESFSFDYTSYAISSGEDDRIISFNFEVIHPETESVPITRSDVGLFFETVAVKQNRIFEFKYLGQRILLWGIVQADCGTGINVAILHDPADALYGKVKAFIRKPNVNGTDIWIPFKNKSLRRLCANDFYEMEYTTHVEDFNFTVIKQLIQQNQAFPYNSIQDPFKGVKGFW